MRFIRKTGVICLATLAVIGFYFLAGTVAVEASPADPDVVKVLAQPDGTRLKFRLWGDEFAHGWQTIDGYTVTRNEISGFWEYAVRDKAGWLIPSGIVVGKGLPPAPRYLRPSQEVVIAKRAERGLSTPGEMRLASPPAWAGSDTDVLFIMVEFTDVACTFTDAQMETNLFGGGASGPGDLDDYFWEISYGNLTLDGTVEGGGGCYGLANNQANYDVGPDDARDLVREAIDLADGDVNFADYDNDGDGKVDALGIIYAGGGAHDGCKASTPPDNLWPHSWDLESDYATDDGVSVRHYIIQSEITYGLADGICDEMQTVGLFAHEFGHALGLPDYYDTDDSSEGVGYWSAMASQFLDTVNSADTPPHYDPFSKWWLGWLTPTDYTGFTGDGPIPQVETTGFVARFLDNPDGPQIGGSGEYFLVENRQRVGFDSALPGCGLAIWHVEESMTHNKNEGHTTASHRLLDIEEADGLDELDSTGDRGDAGDLYPGSTGNRFFADATYPHAHLYDGSTTNIRIANISDCGPVMSANFGNPTVDLAITKSDSPDPVVAGEQLSYAVTVVNHGPGYATNVEAIDTLPLGVTYQTDTDSCVLSPGSGPGGEDQLVCDLGNMMSGEVSSFTIVVLVDDDVVANAGGPTTLRNTISVDAEQDDPVLTNNTATATTVVNDRADVWVTKDCKPDDPIYVGDKATCTIRVGNSGPSTARSVETVDEFLSVGTFTFDDIRSSAGVCNVPAGTTSVECDLGDMAPGARVTIEIDVSANEPQNINDEVHVTSDTPDPNDANNWATDEVNIVEFADLQVFKDCKPDPPNTVWAGMAAYCTIRVKNWGPSTAHTVYLIDHFIADGTFEFVDVSATGAVTCSFPAGPQDHAADVTCDVGDMDPGAEETIVATFLANEGMDINNTATASGLTYDPDTGNNSASDGVTVKPHADLALTKTATPNPVIAGSQLTYDLSVTNNGPSTAVNVVIADVLPSGVTIDLVTSPDGTCNAGDPGNAALPTHCTVDTLAAGATATMQIVVTVEPQILGTISNNAKVSSDVVDLNNSNNLAVVDVTVDAEVDLGVTKSDFPDPVLAGDPLTYDVTVTNYGPSTAIDVQLVDHLPPDVVSLVGYTVSNGSGTCALTEDPQGAFHLECDLNDLNPGQFVTVFIEVMVDSSVPDGATICNNVEVWSETPDTAGHPNTAEECTLVNAEADLEMFKDALFDASNPSRTVVYFLDVINHGPSDAHDVYVIDRLPLTAKKVVYVFDNSNGVCWYDEGLHEVHCDIGTLPAYDPEYPHLNKFHVDIYVDMRGSVDQIMNEAEVFSSTTDPNPANNIAYKGIRIKGGVIKPPNSPKPR